MLSSVIVSGDRSMNGPTPKTQALLAAAVNGPRLPRVSASDRGMSSEYSLYVRGSTMEYPGSIFEASLLSTTALICRRLKVSTRISIELPSRFGRTTARSTVRFPDAWSQSNGGTAQPAACLHPRLPFKSMSAERVRKMIPSFASIVRTACSSASRPPSPRKETRAKALTSRCDAQSPLHMRHNVRTSACFPWKTSPARSCG